jgi:hemoglobin
MSSLPDLAGRPDIERLVDAFYTRVQADDLLGPIFNDIAQVDWSSHLPRMYEFWESVLFGAPAFKGDPLSVHRLLARQASMTPREFERWIALFHDTVGQLFEGPVADEAKLRASRIAGVMQYHIAADARVGTAGEP